MLSQVRSRRNKAFQIIGNGARGDGERDSESKERKRVSHRSMVINVAMVFGAAFLYFLSLLGGLDPSRAVTLRDGSGYIVHTLPRVIVWDGSVPANVSTAYSERHRKSRKLSFPMSTEKSQKTIANSNEYKDLDEYTEDPEADCQLEYEWQKTSRPNCNGFHEFDATTPTFRDGTERYRYLTHGYYRDVLSAVDDDHQFFVLKPMRYKHRYVMRNFDRMRRDAITMDRLTGEKYILNVYGFCGTSGFSEFANGGDVETTLWPDGTHLADVPQLEKLRIATQASMALNSVHSIDKKGRPSVAHTDITPGQFIKVGDTFKLNDFNRARFLRYSRKNGNVCPFYVGNNAGNNRSPEEYAYEGETEKVDIYSLGNMFFTLLQGEEPFEDLEYEEASAKVMDGTRPTIYADLWNSTDPVNKVLKQAMIWCHAQEPDERPAAHEIADFFKQQMEKLDPGRLVQWGDA